MFAKFARSLIAFGAVFAAYQAYALFVPPLLEGPGVRRSESVVTEEDWDRGSDAVRRYQKLLANYLPTGHWSLNGPIKVVESGPVLLAFDDWNRDDRGQVRVSKLAVLMFPTPRGDGRGEGPVAPRDAVVLEVPGDPAADPANRDAAVLQFDGGFDPARGQVGKLIAGSFLGPITIRSDGAEPGVEDDLWIETRDLRLNGPLLSTPHEVRVRHGLSRGGGRRLQIKLIEEPGSSRGAGLKIAGVESLEVFEQVELELHAEGLSLTGDAPEASPQRVTRRDDAVQPTAHEPTPARPRTANQKTDVDLWLEAAGGTPTPAESQPRNAGSERVPTPRADPPPAIVAAPAPKPTSPVRVTCNGSLLIDLTRFVASFTDRVFARQLNLNGQSDQLACERLDVHFADEGFTRVDPATDPDFTSSQREAMRDLRPQRLVATGQPVKLDAPARGVIARGRRLDVLIEQRRVSLAGEGAFLRHTAGEVHAPLVRYQHPPKGDDTPIGRLWIAGPGWLRMNGSPGRGGDRQPITARWRQTPGVEHPVRLVHRDRGPALIVLGRPEIEAPGLGKLSADRIEASLAETPVDGDQGPAIEIGDHPIALLPEQVTAAGRVSIDSPDLLGRTEELTAWFRPTGASTRNASAQSGSPFARSNDGRSAGAKPRTRYELTARRMELDVLLGPGNAAPQRLLCAGGARFSQQPRRQQPRQQGEEPLVVSGQRIRVDRLDTPAVRVAVFGAQPEASAPGSPRQNPQRSAPPLAIIESRGVRLQAGDVHLDQQTGRLWAEGPGTARLRTDRDLFGQATAATTDLHLRWRGGFDFDGSRVTVNQDVFGEGAHDWVRTNRLVATLSQPIDFRPGAKPARRRRDGRPAVEIARVDCFDGVEIDHRSVDERGQRSHERAQLQTLAYEHATGALSGQGPGWVRSVHLSSGKSLSPSPTGGGRVAQNMGGGGAANSGARRSRANAAAEKLRFLRVDFQQGLSGNLNTRVLAFHQRVRAVYGPVLAWQHTIRADNPNGLPPDTVTLASDHLQVNEDPQLRGRGSELGPAELLATGSVRLETTRKGGGVITSQSTTASYAQSKELFTIEGVPGNYATIWIQDKPGQPPKVQTARKFSFWRNTNQLRIEDLGGFDSGPMARPPARNLQR